MQQLGAATPASASRICTWMAPLGMAALQGGPDRHAVSRSCYALDSALDDVPVTT